MPLSFDVFWSFRSPYSYLATHQLVAIECEYDVAINVRPVYPIAIRTPDFFKRVNPMWLPYLLNDCKRIAEMKGVPFAWPSPDPVVQDLETREIASEQPYIHRLTRLGVAATEGGNGLAFISEVSRLIFGGVKGWNTGDHLILAAERAGLSLSELEAKVSANAEAYDAKIRQNEADQKTSGHWGVPLMVFEGEPFFGQDRIDVLIWRMKQAGLQARSETR
jgi:2-hydroxychromene-2-carboxylate isomerase